MSWRENAKKRAALEATKLLKDGFVVGLGSGSTVTYAIKGMGETIQQKGLQLFGVPTSYQSLMLAVENGIPITTLYEHQQLDLAIDGADQIDRKLNLIKGMGGALMREKIVASAAKKFVIVADETKLVERLGTNHPVPIEVFPFSLPTVNLKIQEIGGTPILRVAKNKVGPTITDNGNFVVDVDFGVIEEPKNLNLQLKSIPGVIETGLFPEMADIIYIGKPTTVQVLKKKQ